MLIVDLERDDKFIYLILSFNDTLDYRDNECQQLPLLISESLFYRLGVFMSFDNSLRVNHKLSHRFLDELDIFFSYCFINIQ